MSTIRAEVNISGKAFNGGQREQVLRRAYKLALFRAGTAYQAEVRPRTPYGVHGAMRGGWLVEFEDDQSVVVYNTQEYALAVESGRKTGKGIPLEPLELWIRRKVGMTDPVEVTRFAKAISWKAKKKGLDGHGTGFAAKAFKDAIPEMNAELQKVGASIVKGLEQ